jgi:iron complex transport system ATP-binding protein
VSNNKFPVTSSEVCNASLIILLGRNGIGKSTLLRTLAGLQPPLDGELNICGRDIRRYSSKEKAALIGFVSTERPAVENMTVFNLVALGRFSYTNWLGTLSDDDELIVRRSMRMSGITHLANENINEISDGELQRVMIARTLAQDTEIIILDEPVAFLDLPNRFEILLLLRNLAWNERKTVILSAHDLDIAIRLADIIWIMTDKGLEQGAPEDFAIKDGFGAIFRDTDIAFNYDLGIVDFGIVPSRTISLTCDDTRIAFWLKKAFVRLGFRLSDDAEISVTANDGVFVCKHRHSENVCSTVEELCRAITS